MKKVLPFLSFLLLFTGVAKADEVVITSVSQIVEGHRYTIQACDTARGALYYNEAVSGYLCSTGKYGVAYDPTSPAQQWTFTPKRSSFTKVPEEGKYYIKNVAADKYIYGCEPNWELIADDATFFYKVEEGTNGGFILKSASVQAFNKEFGLNLINIDNDTDYGTSLKNNTQDAGNNFIITDLDAETVEVTYTVKFNGEAVGTATATQGVGAAPAVPASLAKSFVNYTYDVDTLTATTTAVTAEATWDGPFDISTDYAGAKWYNIYVKDSTKYLTYYPDLSPNVVVIPLANSGTNALQQWAFTGNPYSGFKLINSSAGATLFAASGNPEDDEYEGADTYLNITDDATTYTKKLWTVERSTQLTDGFYLRNEDGYALNQNTSYYVSYWTEGADLSSTFVVREAPTTAVYDMLRTAYDKGVGIQATGYADATWGKFAATSSSGLTTAEAGNALDAAIAEAATYLTDEYKAAHNTPADQAAIDAQTAALIVATGNLDLYIPTAPSATSPGMYFRLRSANLENGYLTCPAVGSTTPTVTVTTTPGDETIWCWAYGTNAQTHGTTGCFLLSYYGGMYLRFGNSSTTVSSLTDASLGTEPYSYSTGQSFKLFSYGWVPGTYSIYNNGKYLYSGTTDGNTPQYAPDLDQTKGFAWYIEPVTTLDVPLNAAGGASYATLFLPVPATVDVQACNARLNEDKTKLILTDITDIPARTPVVLYSSNGAEKATVTLLTDNPTETYTGDLTGTSVPLTWNTNNYALGAESAVPGFYHWSGTQLNPNRAYLDASKLSSSVRGLAFTLGNETTGIQTPLTSATTGGKVYDLQGRRVLNAQKGLYIVGGKKVLVK